MKEPKETENARRECLWICFMKSPLDLETNFQYAFPWGFGEPEITSEENVKKELLEEIGAVQVEETYLGKVLPDSGILANQVDVFMCKVSNVEVKSFYEGIQDVVLLNEAELDEWILKKKIEDGFTLAAYSLYKVNKANGRKGL